MTKRISAMELEAGMTIEMGEKQIEAKEVGYNNATHQVTLTDQHGNHRQIPSKMTLDIVFV